MRRALLTLTALAALLVPAATAAAQALPPSLTADTRYAFSGIAEHVPGEIAAGAAIDPALDRHYAVGTTGDDNVAVIARRSNGALDTTFAGDGALSLDVTSGSVDSGAAIVVLPDSRLRIAGASDAVAVVIGLLPDGSVDPGFGVVPVPAGDEATALAVDAIGRLAVTGESGTDTFVAVLEPTGTPTFPAQTVDAERAVDVAWGAGGPVALVDVAGGQAQLRAFTISGAPDWTTVLDVGGSATEPGALVSYGGRFWVTGSVTSGGDMDAYLARVDGSGGSLESRRFDMRGMVFQGSQQVNSAGRDLTIVPGEPDTLVVGGASATDLPQVGAAAFNGLDGPVSQLATGDIVLRVLSGQGTAVGMAGASTGAVAVVVDLKSSDATPVERIGMGRLLVDAEKQCDLAISVVNPLELIMRATAPSTATLRATNNGKRACGGEIAVPAPYSIAPGPLATGKLPPGGSVTLTAQIAYGATFPAVDTLVFTLTAPADVALGDNVARLRVAFSFCDLQLRRIGGPRVIGNEGARRYEFTVRNVGTAACSNARIAVVGKGRRARAGDRYRVPAGQSVTDEVDVAARKSARVGRRAAIAFIARARDDVQLINNLAGVRPRVVRAGDTTTRKPAGGKRFRGKAKGGSAKHVRKRTLKVARVEIAVRRRGKGCRWLSDAEGRMRTVVAGRKGACDQPVWVKVRGKRKWRLGLDRALPKGRYVLLSRAVLVNGVPEGAFGRKDRNMVRFRVR